MADTLASEGPAQPDRGGQARRIGIYLLAVVLVGAWPLATRLRSQPQVDPAARKQCRIWAQEYRTSLLAYWSGADTDDRVNLMLNRYAEEGPRHLDRLIVQGAAGLTGQDLALIEAARRSLEGYNADPARRASDVSQSSVKLIAVAQTLDRLEKSLAR